MPNDYKPVEALLNLHRSRRCGVLRFQKEAVKKQIVLVEGRVAFAESNVAEEHLAKVMVAIGLLNRSDLTEIASLMKKGKTSEEAVLSVTGDNKDLLQKARRAQAIRILASLLALQSCEMSFYSATDPRGNRLSLDLGIPELLLESARAAASSRLVTANLLLEKLSPESGSDAGTFAINSSEALAYDLVARQTPPADRLSLFSPGKDILEQSLSVLSLLGLIKAARAKKGTPGRDETLIALQQLEEMLSRLEVSSAYEILSVRTDAGPDEIQAAYHELARRFHPDRFQSKEFDTEVHGQAELVFTAIKEAYHKLKDPAARAQQDEEQKRAVPAPAASPAPVRAPKSANEAEAVFRQGRVLLGRREFARAAEHLKTAVWLCPENSDYHHYLGVAESASPKSRKSAEQHFLKAIELNFISIDSRMALARLYLEVKLNRKAEQVLRQVLEIDPENKQAQQLLNAQEKQ